MTQQTTHGHTNTASVLAIIGGVLMVLAGLIFVAVSAIIIPHLPSMYFSTNSTTTISSTAVQGFASFIIGGLGAFGLISGAIVLGSGVMLQVNPNRRRAWGVLILVFSVLSFLGTGGFIVGAVLGIVGGILALTWKPSIQQDGSGRPG